MNVLSIDTGKHACGAAIFRDGALHAAGLVESPAEKTERGTLVSGVAMALAVEAWVEVAGLPIDVVVVETLRTYAHGSAKPADLFVLQGIAYACAARFPRAKLVGVEPAEWKGQVPREVMGNRIAVKVQARGWDARLDIRRASDGRSITKTQLNDVLHAIGIGLFWIEKASVRREGHAAVSSSPSPS